MRILISESQYQRLQEVDWEDTFKDVKAKCMNTDVMVDYLNRVRANARYGAGEYGKREKFSKGMPFIHAKSKAFKRKEKGAKDEFDVDVDYFIEQITKKPKNIVNTNEKMLKSGGRNQFVYKTGIPAFRGIVYDKAKDMFFVINTCIGAGECVTFCYALKGRYIQYPVSYDSMTRRLNYLMNHPDEYEEQMYKEIKNIAENHKALKGYKPQVVIRWNDSGDFFSKRYVKMANRVIKRLQEEGYNVIDYAYTKVADVAAGDDIKNVSFSSGANKKQSQKAKAGNNKMSYVVPSGLFKDLNFQKVSDEEELVKRVAEFFNLNVDNVITYEDMMGIRDKKVPKWYVIVTPEDGDDAAFREDVKAILLTQH